MQLRVFTGDSSDPRIEAEISEATTPETLAPETLVSEMTVPEEHLLGQYIPLHYHYNMLQDADRVGAFRDAIEMAVRPGMRVLELGGGTGILSSFAARRGAQVSCVERNPQLVQKSRALLAANGLADCVDVIESDAFAYLPSEPVDVVICEMLHVAMLREKQLSVIESFKRRYRRAFGDRLPRFLPEASILMVQPVEHCFDFAGYWAPIPVFQAPALHIEGTRQLSPLAAYSNIFYDAPIPERFERVETFVASEAGMVTAVRFVTQNVVAMDVDQQRAVNWPNQCMVLPVEKPLRVEAGQTLRIAFQYDSGGTIDSLAGSLALRAGAAPRSHAA